MDLGRGSCVTFRRSLCLLGQRCGFSGQNWLAAGEAIIEACPPIATAFNRSWMPFRTLRCRWPFLAAVRDLARLDRVVQARIDAALVRFAGTGHGDVKSLKDRPGELLDERHRHSVRRRRGQTGLPANFRQTAPEIHGSLVSPQDLPRFRHGSSHNRTPQIPAIPRIRLKRHMLRQAAIGRRRALRVRELKWIYNAKTPAKSG